MRRLYMLLIVMLSLITAGISATTAAVAAGQDLLLFYSNDVVGETEPCG